MWNKLKQQKIFYIIIPLFLLAVVGSFIIFLGLSTKSFDNNLQATDMIGQYDGADVFNPIPIYTKNSPNDGPNRLGFDSPKGIYVGGSASFAFIADSGNNRILVYNIDAHSSFTSSDHVPDYILGQSNYYTNTSGNSASTLNNPTRISYDSGSSRLFVSDTGNNRILVYDVSDGIADGEDAINVLGQADFVSNSSGLTASTLSSPEGIYFDFTNNKLYVADTGNNRVMVFDTSSITNGEDAINVLGQADFISSTAGTTQNTMYSPKGVTMDEATNRLFVADTSNNRVLVYDVSSITDGQNAVNVLGQIDFTSSDPGLTDSTMNYPHDVVYFGNGENGDGNDGTLFVSEKNNSRVTQYNVNTITDGESAVHVIGQENFTTNNQNSDQDGIHTPEGIAVNLNENAHFFVIDSGVHRLMVFEAQDEIVDGVNASDSLGQFDQTYLDNPLPIYTKTSPNNGPNLLGFYDPTDISLDEVNHRLFISDSVNNRVLVHDLSNDNVLLDYIPDFVLGQSDFYSNSTGTTASTMGGGVTSIEFDPVNNRLFVADNSNNRILIFDTTTITNGEDAVAVFGQSDFTSNFQAYSATGLSSVLGLAYDSVHNRLFATSDARVLVYDTVLIENGEAAINILGQTDFDQTASVVTQSGVKTPFSLAYDSARDLLFVADTNAYRVTVYDTTSIANGENAVYVIGAPDFTTRINDSTQSKIGPSIGLLYYSGRLFVSDSNRVLLFDVNEITNGENAINVFGQSDFTSNTGSTSQTGLYYAKGLAYNSINDYFYVADSGNNRVMIFDLPPAPGINLSLSSITITEGNSDSFTVVLTAQPTSNVTLIVSSTDTTEGTVSPQTLTFTSANWDTPQTITISAPSDANIDGDQYYNIVVSVDDANSDDEYDPMSDKIVSITTVDDGSTGGGGGGGGGSLQPGINIVHTGDGTSVSENTTDTFTISLKSNITSDVVISIVSSNTDEGTVSPTTITFSNNNWNTPQTITLTGISDGVVDGNQSYNIIISVVDALSATSYDGIADVVFQASTSDINGNQTPPIVLPTDNPNTSKPNTPNLPNTPTTNNPTNNPNSPTTLPGNNPNGGNTNNTPDFPGNGTGGNSGNGGQTNFPGGNNPNQTPSTNEGDGSVNQDPNSNNKNNVGIFGVIINILSNVISSTIGKIVVALGVTSTAVLSVFRLVFSNPVGITDLGMRAWSMFLYGFGIKKRHKPWGVVFDSITKQPLDPVYLKLVDIEKKTMATCFTDIDGRYGFLVEPGHYHIIAEKTHYVFPSSKLNSKERDEVYTDLYYGNYIEIKEFGQVISKNIPMDRIGFDWNEYAKLEQHRMRWYKRSDKAVGQIIDIFFLVGFIISGLTLLGGEIKSYNVIIFAFYGILFAFNHTQFGNYAKGKAFFKEGSPIAYGILRVFSKETGREITHKIIDRLGNYFCLAPNGHYNVSIEQKNPDGSYSKIHSEEGLEITKGYLKKEFKV